MARRFGRGAGWIALTSVAVSVCSASWCPVAIAQAPGTGTQQPGTGTQAPAESDPTAMDLKGGRVDTTPLFARREIDPNGAPVMPPRTVEGTMVSLDQANRAMTVETQRYGDVRIGLPPDLVPLRKGQESTLEAIRPGDRIYATVETAYGVRAVKLVSEPPMNPLINYVGIPLLLLAALAIWWTGRGRAEAAETKAPAKPAGKT